MRFEPIAVVGQACVLPMASSPQALWANVEAGRNCLSPAPEDRWGVPRSEAMGTPSASIDRTWSDIGGYVQGFDRIFDPTGFLLPADEVAGLDPVFQMVMHTARESLRSAGCEGELTRTGMVLGNLAFPSMGLGRFAQSVWLDAQGAGYAQARARLVRPAARNRFNSGLPALLAARALGLGAGAFALDAACASSLYAIKLACDRLHEGSADLMLAGAVQQSDNLCLHIGFTALGAMSPSGRSRPFHRDADGLVPAEGAGFVVLQRLSDALASGRPILGVIRGVGLSNDGRGRGLLAPSEQGQERAMRLAYAQSDLTPRDIGLVECHATGTPVGDAAEIRSMARVYADCDELPIGSLKSNLGHLITVAGVAALIKVIAAMNAGKRPPTLHVEQPIDALSGTPFRLLREGEAWRGSRRAAISAFGFGGNNAHLLVEALDEYRPSPLKRRSAPAIPPQVAIVGVGARVADGESAADFARVLFLGETRTEARRSVELELEGLKFPPADLAQSLAQQTLVLEAAREAASGLVLPRERTAVLVGMGCDVEAARYCLRWRIGTHAAAWSADGTVDQTWLAEARNAVSPALQAAGVVGTMPNMPANRISSQLDLGGPGYTVSAEEASGMVALELAARALSAGEIDAALVGGVDLSHEIAHCAALDELNLSARPADAAVVLVLKRLTDAKRDANRVYAVLDPDESSGLAFGDGEHAFDLKDVFGKAHAAHGLLQVAAAAIAVGHAARPRAGSQAAPWFGSRNASIAVNVLDAPPARLRLRGESARGWIAVAPPSLHVYSGKDRAEALSALESGTESDAGPARLVLVASDPAELASRASQANRWLELGGSPPEGVAFSDRPISGQIAFVFTGAAAAYPGMGHELALAFPELVESLGLGCEEIDAATGWLYDANDGKPTHPLDQLWGTSFVCQLHARVTRRVLGIKPAATIGYSSGESNALFAMGAWNDLGDMMRESRVGPLFSNELVGTFDAARRSWARLSTAGSAWSNLIIAAPVEEVREALAGEPLVHLTIINTSEECVVGGEAQACARVAARIGAHRTLALDYAMLAHCPEVGEVRDAWWRLHHRATSEVPDVRFYTNATGNWYHADAVRAADAITGQALDTLDFRRTIEQAWMDGVRVFIEHGPRGMCSGWIRRILGDREHLAVALDANGRSGVRQLMNAAGALLASGVRLDLAALERKLADVGPKPASAGAKISLPAHPPAVKLPLLKCEPQSMARAPVLAPILRAASPTDTAAAHTSVAEHAVMTTTYPSPQLRTSAHRLPEIGSATQAVIPGSPLARLIAQQGQIAQLHRDFVSRQAQVHGQFLAFQESAAAELMRTYRLSTQGAGLRNTGERIVLTSEAENSSIGASGGLPGPKFNRAQLEMLAGGAISSVFGEQFAAQDGYARQVRMPQPPLLLADRVTGIDAVPGSMGLGTIWTETDVRADSWYLNDEGRMPAGVMIEAGQADLLLISWLGVDALNRGERVYRLLGCELVYHEGLPSPGDTLVYDIHVDGHAKQGDVRLFFFHYDCRVRGQVRLSVRNGQAGFFTDRELAESSGVLWNPEDEMPSEGPLDPPAVACAKNRFSRTEIDAFTDGRAYACFGAGFERAQTHVRSPRISSGKMRFLDEVTHFNVAGGPWGKGYLRAQTPVTPEDWYFSGHFKNDPCMPGTLMFEGCLQAMAVYLTGLGFTLERDGWRFEPVPDVQYSMRCRGQVTPSSRLVVYEIYVREVIAGPIPTLYADLLGSVDGRKAFYARRVGLRLVPDWPLETWQHRGPATTQTTGRPVPLPQLGGLKGYSEHRPVAEANGVRFDYRSLLSCAWGRPSMAFGPFYARFDSTRRAPRLPGPPYHFMSRIARLSGPLGGMQAGTSVEAEYDVPPEQWYFQQNGARCMPMCVLMEAALQPCGWLASYVGSALVAETDLMFRNLDGTGKLLKSVFPDAGTLRTKVKLLSISRSAGMIIEDFDVQCFIGDQRVFEMKTVFGFFPKEAFENQLGLPVSDKELARLAADSQQTWDLSSRPEKYCRLAPRLPDKMLLMLDRVTGFWPNGGDAGLGYLRAEKSVDADEWFFKAHFFQDPVQPGSLGIEALIQLLQFFMLETGMAAGVSHPRFEPLMLGRELTWKYRGQVVPEHKTITTELQIIETGEDAEGRYAIAEGWLWVDGKRIYAARNLGMRIVAGPPLEPQASVDNRDEVLDTRAAPWLLDHRPTWTVPTLPMMSMVERVLLAAAADSSAPVTTLSELQVHRWLSIPEESVRLRSTVSGKGDERSVSLLARSAESGALPSRYEPIATALVGFQELPQAPAPLSPLRDISPEPDPYESGALFHGPAFQYLTKLRIGSAGASGILIADRGTVPRGMVHQGLLDAALHVIPHDALWRWSADIPRDHIAYPHRLKEMRFFARLPDTGELRVEARFSGFDNSPRFPAIDVQIISGTAVLVDFQVVEVLLPAGPLGAAQALERRAFLRDRKFVPGIRLSRLDGNMTQIDAADINRSDWLPGTIGRVYGIAKDVDATVQVAVKDHVAVRAQEHPSRIQLAPDMAYAVAASRPLQRFPVGITQAGNGAVQVVDSAPANMDLTQIRDYWAGHLGIRRWPIEDLYMGLISRFVGDVVLVDPDAHAEIRGRSVLFLANHQVGIESLLFSVLGSALSGTPVMALAKAEHSVSWLGRLIAHGFSFPGVVDPKVIAFFDQEDGASLIPIVDSLANELHTTGKSLLIHVEGARSYSCRIPVREISGTVIDMAFALDLPIVPVRFARGVPVEPLVERIDFPIGFCRQDYWLGRPILPSALRSMPLRDRKLAIVDAINRLGPDAEDEAPAPPDAAFAATVEDWMARTGATFEHAVLYATLASLENPSDMLSRLLQGVPGWRVQLGSSQEDRWLAEFARPLFGPRGPQLS